ncbi:Sulfite exporter TauE/SafE [Halopseudomonas litoralis]|uniref:Probable membrane transporter protein n=1 Tax=Halopseudomonas litoralis TaxID=797277 RepID=A0A1H1S1H2_9GAMM|nr:TSUP family transporter [Halopseudomonas litoralis]SDS41708.1 Sulfite exporter TauE/SafE [Halopseudomonas litoralis]
MQALLDLLLPAALPPLTSAALVALSAVTSAITASLGIGGGVLLLAIMATVMPPTAIIPVHGMVQLGSNLGRAAMTIRHINLRLILWFAPGVLLGAWLGSLFLVDLPLSLVQLCIAGFILLLCWGPPIPAIATGPVGTLLAAGITTFISLFVGATGPLVAAFVKQQQQGERFSTVATFATAMCLQHAPKALIYGAAGFVFADWLGLILMMVIAGAVGTWLGLRLLRRLTDSRFTLVFNTLLTLLALRLIWQAVGNL